MARPKTLGGRITLRLSLDTQTALNKQAADMGWEPSRLARNILDVALQTMSDKSIKTELDKDTLAGLKSRQKDKEEN